MAVAVFEGDAVVSSCWAAELVLCFGQVVVSCHVTGLSPEREDVALIEELSGLLACWAAESAVYFEEEAGFYHMTAKDSELEKLMMANSVACDEH